MKKPKQTPASLDWRITLRRGMVPAGRDTVKVFTSPTAFDGYVGALRSLGVLVHFTSPFVAHCQETT
jgi:hypothetical protein